MKGYLILVGNMAESLDDDNLFSACTPVVKVGEEPFSPVIALNRFLASTFQKGKGPVVTNRWPIKFYGPNNLLPEYLTTGVDLSSGAALEIKVLQVKIEKI